MEHESEQRAEEAIQEAQAEIENFLQDLATRSLSQAQKNA